MDRLAEEKAAVRSRLRAVRQAIPRQERASMASRVESRLMELPAVDQARTVLLFYAFGSEVPTKGLILRLLERGRRVLLPFLEASTMEAAELRSDQILVSTSYGPKEPPERVPVDPGEVDAVITPGLGFDRSGYRIGYGGGYYDQYLRRLGPHATRIGIGFHAQLIQRVPHGPRDERLDWVVTDQESVACQRAEVPPSDGRQ
jgi:5-formyltetrahydrofolate cyclo-ligase